MSYSNEQIIKYSKPLSLSEQQQCESSVRVFERILSDYGFTVTKIKYNSNNDDLDYGFHVEKDGVTFTIFLQGSYGNGTCVRQDSDVDIAMICESTFRGNYPSGKNGANYGFTSSSFSISEFKNNLTRFINSSPLYSAFNHNKCIDFKGNNSSRKDIDIVPSLRYRDYSKDYYCDENNYSKGVLIKCNDGTEILNYPEQSHDNSTDKNKRTNYYYKKVVRIFKNIKHDMEDDGYSEAKHVSSYGLECILYNVPDILFIKDGSLFDIVLYISKYLSDHIDDINHYYESNGILRIFDNSKNDLKTYRLFLLKLANYVRL